MRYDRSFMRWKSMGAVHDYEEELVDEDMRPPPREKPHLYKIGDIWFCVGTNFEVGRGFTPYNAYFNMK